MELRTPQFGVPYWACPTPHEPPVVTQSPRQVDYAFALVSVLPGFDDGERTWTLADYDADRTDPSRFVDRVVSRLTVTRESSRRLEREHRASEASHDDAGADEQASLSGWS